MNTIFVHRDGRTEQVTSIERSWLSPGAGAYLWVDLAAPSIPESLVLTDTFGFHRLAVERAKSSSHWPAVDAYDGYLFAPVVGPDADVGFFVGAHYLVSVHWQESKAVGDLVDSVGHGGKQFDEGPFAMFHRLVDAMAVGLEASVVTLIESAEALEKALLTKGSTDSLSSALHTRRRAFLQQRRLAHQADAIGRLADRDVTPISDEMAYRFRDVSHRLVRLADWTSAVAHSVDGALAASGAARRRRWI